MKHSIQFANQKACDGLHWHLNDTHHAPRRTVPANSAMVTTTKALRLRRLWVADHRGHLLRITALSQGDGNPASLINDAHIAAEKSIVERGATQRAHIFRSADASGSTIPGETTTYRPPIVRQCVKPKGSPLGIYGDNKTEWKTPKSHTVEDIQFAYRRVRSKRLRNMPHRAGPGFETDNRTASGANGYL